MERIFSGEQQIRSLFENDLGEREQRLIAACALESMASASEKEIEHIIKQVNSTIQRIGGWNTLLLENLQLYLQAEIKKRRSRLEQYMKIAFSPRNQSQHLLIESERMTTLCVEIFRIEITRVLAELVIESMKQQNQDK